MNKFLNTFFYILVGVLGGISFPPFNKIVILSVVSFSIFLSYMLYKIKIAKSWKMAFCSCWGLSFISNLISFSWMSRPFDFVGMASVAPFVVGVFCFFWAIFFAIVGVVVFYIRDDRKYLGFAVLIALIEWVKSWIFTGFAWNPVALVWSNSLPVMQVLSLVGVYGLCFITVFVLTLPYFVLEKRWRVFNSAIFYSVIAVFLFVLGFGYWRINKYQNFEKVGKVVKLVNLDVGQDEKFNVSKVDEYLSFSKKGAKADLVIWSETSVPVDLFRDEYNLMKLMNFNTDNSSLIVGFDRIEFLSRGNLNLYNVMALIDDIGIVDFYDKMHLVPFGEYMPLKKFIPFKKFVEGVIDFSSGDRKVIFNIAGFNFYPIICYEGIFSGLSLPKTVDFIVNISNDKWFSKYGKIQHFDLVKYRAVEEGVPLIRVANDGISGVVSPLGDMVSSFDGRGSLRERGVLDVELVKRIDRPLFSVIGNFGVVMVLLVLLICCYDFKSGKRI